ncbi:uncharacterized protein [Gossypium hirsutum]|uniref:Uncharacterized protein n=1 Tax=Gossypium hirsutum TaxID=3635 RepID=A0A1U8M3A8_GOSHI|nr:uncharacterized protein LOC107933563 [Gossypium hirsutum]
MKRSFVTRKKNLFAFSARVSALASVPLRHRRETTTNGGWSRTPKRLVGFLRADLEASQGEDHEDPEAWLRRETHPRNPRVSDFMLGPCFWASVHFGFWAT